MQAIPKAITFFIFVSLPHLHSFFHYIRPFTFTFSVSILLGSLGWLSIYYKHPSKVVHFEQVFLILSTNLSQNIILSIVSQVSFNNCNDKISSIAHLLHCPINVRRKERTTLPPLTNGSEVQ